MGWPRPERLLAGLSATVLLASVVPTAAVSQGEEAPVPVLSQSVVGDLRLHRFVSKVFGHTRYLRVLVPDGYDAPDNAARRYPVLYMADRQNLFDPTTSVFRPSEWRMDETVHALVSTGRVPPVIVVGVDDAGRFARDHEYLPWPDTAAAAGYAHYDPTPQGKRYPESCCGRSCHTLTATIGH